MTRRRTAGGTALATRPPARLPAPLIDQSLSALEDAIGGRPALVAALLHAPKSRDLDYLLGLIAVDGTPAPGRWDTRVRPLADICAEGGITPGELIEAYKAGEINRAQALAIQKVGEKLGAVAEDTMRRALPRIAPDGECLEGDIEHKKLALEMGKLLPKAGGVNLNVQQQVGVFTGAAAGGSLERMQAATDAILYGDATPPPDPTVVEGEVAPDASDAELAAVLEGDWREDPHP